MFGVAVNVTVSPSLNSPVHVTVPHVDGIISTSTL
jgi:hypothetical protein